MSPPPHTSPAPHLSGAALSPRPASGEPSPRSSQLLQEASEVEAAVLQLHSKVHDLETRLSRASGDASGAMELSLQLSGCQQQLEEKSRLLYALQERLAGGGGGGGGGEVWGGGGGGGGVWGGGGGGGGGGDVWGGGWGRVAD